MGIYTRPVWVLERSLRVQSQMLILTLRATLLTLLLMAATLVTAAALVLSALILVTITLITISLVLGPDTAEERQNNGLPVHVHTMTI